MGGKVIFTRPCLFCMDNRYGTYRGAWKWPHRPRWLKGPPKAALVRPLDWRSSSTSADGAGGRSSSSNRWLNSAYGTEYILEYMNMV